MRFPRSTSGGQEPVGASYSVTSCDLGVLMDEPTESIPPRNPSAWRMTAGSAGPSGGACPKARCGRWPLS
jgi:hypothetical protein